MLGRILCSCDKLGQKYFFHTGLNGIGSKFCAHVTSLVRRGEACVFLDTLPQPNPWIFKINYLLFQPLNEIQITRWAQFCDICMVRR